MFQVNPGKYKSIFNGFSVTLREDGLRGLGRGWAPTFLGYSVQGLCKFGFYELFKALYNDVLGEASTGALSDVCLRVLGGVLTSASLSGTAGEGVPLENLGVLGRVCQRRVLR